MGVSEFAHSEPSQLGEERGAGGRGETENAEAFVKTFVALSTLLANSGLVMVEIHGTASIKRLKGNNHLHKLP